MKVEFQRSEIISAKWTPTALVLEISNGRKEPPASTMPLFEKDPRAIPKNPPSLWTGSPNEEGRKLIKRNFIRENVPKDGREAFFLANLPGRDWRTRLEKILSLYWARHNEHYSITYYPDRVVGIRREA